MADLVQAQIERERQYEIEGLRAYAEQAKDMADRAGSATGAAPRLIAQLYSELLPVYESIQKQRASGIAGSLRGWLRAVPAESLAVLALQEVFNVLVQVGATSTLQTLCVNLGRRVRSEALVLQAYDVQKAYMTEVEHKLERSYTKSTNYIERTMVNAARNLLGEQANLSNAEYVGIGKLLLAPIIENGYIERSDNHLGPGNMHVYELSPVLRQEVWKVPQFAAAKFSDSMLVPPVPWEDALHGGYLATVWHPLVRRKDLLPEEFKWVNERLRGQRVLGILNYIQDIPLEIHGESRAIVVRCFEEGRGVLGMPSVEPPPKPEYPNPEGWQQWTGERKEEADRKHILWKRRAQDWYTARNDWLAQTREMYYMIRNTDEVDQPRWHPVFCDSRGRMYYRGRVQPQGSDRVKAVLRFSERRALGARGVFWLKVHIANCFGYDKVRMQQRAEWVDEHWDMLLEGSAEPYNSDLYRSNTDAPLQAVVAVQELAAAYASGNPEAWETGLAVGMDATCSGLQLLSALMRDPIGAYLTNCVDNGLEEKSDIYAYVAEVFQRNLDLDTDEYNADAIAFWKANPLPRNVAKHPVMCYTYGITMLGAADYIEDWLDSEGIQIDGQSVPSAWVFYAAKKILEAVAEAVPKAAEFMQWIRTCTGNGPLQWTSAVGFPVKQSIKEQVRKRIKIRSCNADTIVLRETLDTVDDFRMRNSISPNFVHSLDSSLWYLTADKFREAGLEIIGVHDSFAAHPCNVDFLHKAIRESFVELFTEHDALQEFCDSNNLDINEAPSRGNFDVTEFLNSEFGFC